MADKPKQGPESWAEATEKGYFGEVPDPTPNENYAASNSTATNDLPTPETDQGLRAEAHQAQRLDPAQGMTDGQINPDNPQKQPPGDKADLSADSTTEE